MQGKSLDKMGGKTMFGKNSKMSKNMHNASKRHNKTNVEAGSEMKTKNCGGKTNCKSTSATTKNCK